MVTHDVDEAIYMGTRVIVMDANPGRIIADIKIEEDFPRDRSSARLYCLPKHDFKPSAFCRQET